MPAPIISGLVTFLAAETSTLIWDGEIPRQDTLGQNIQPPTDFPAIKVGMEEQGLHLDWTQADPFDEMGPITVYVWDTTRASVENMLQEIFVLLAQSSNWPQIVLGNGYSVFHLLLQTWHCMQLEGVRTQQSELLYEGQLRYEIGIHGITFTQ